MTSLTPLEVGEGQTVIDAPAWTADWLNAWLAAIGMCVRDPRVRLAWTEDPIPHARFSLPTVLDIEGLLPTNDELAELVIARQHSAAKQELPQGPTLEQYAERAAIARTSGDLSLGAFLSDLRIDPKTERLNRSPFNPGAPGGETLYQRLARTAGTIEPPDAVTRSLNGEGILTKGSGLGYDFRRIAAPTVAGEMTVDPVVETLAFYGSLLFPMGEYRARGWTASPDRTGSFRWPAWKPFLDWAAIDALLDVHSEQSPEVSATFESVPFQKAGEMDQTRGFGSRIVLRL